VVEEESLMYAKETDPFIKKIMELEEEVEYRRDRFNGIRSVVAEQAENPGLWFQATTIGEEHLQRELRRLHVAIEGDLDGPDTPRDRSH
jgi:hypothetical protein